MIFPPYQLLQFLGYKDANIITPIRWSFKFELPLNSLTVHDKRMVNFGKRKLVDQV